MRINSKHFLTIALATGCGILANTATANALLNNGAYINGGVGYGYVSQSVFTGSTENDTMMYGLEAGYYIFHGIGVEAGGYYFPSVASNSKKVVNNNYSGQLSIIGSLPLSLISHIFCKLGMGLSHSSFGNLPTQVSYPGKSYTKITGFGAVGMRFATPLGPSLSIEGLAFTNNGKQVPARYGALATVGWQF